MPNQTMVYSCSAPEQEYTMVWFGIFLYLLISSLKIRFCEQSVFAKSPLCTWCDIATNILNIFRHDVASNASAPVADQPQSQH